MFLDSLVALSYCHHKRGIGNMESFNIKIQAVVLMLFASYQNTPTILSICITT